MNNPLEALRVFCVAAESGNFREAATRLSVSPQVVTRVVKALEDELGEPLFHRSTRGVQVSDFGMRLLERARAAVAGVDTLFQPRAHRALSSHAGTVRVAAPSVIGRSLLPDALAPRVAEHPGLVIDLRLSEVVADVVQQQIDVGVRIGALRDSRFVVRPVAKVHFLVVASPALLDRVGTPRDLDGLFARPTTGFIDRNNGRTWAWHFKGGRQVTPENPAFVTDDPEAECAAAVAGFGFSQVPAFMAAPHLRAGRLVSLFDSLAPDPWPLYVYRVQRTPVPARVRLVYDTLLEAMAAL